MAGTVIGNIMGVKQEEEKPDTGGDTQEDQFSQRAMAPKAATGDDEDGGEEGVTDFKAEARYADHMKKPNEAAVGLPRPNPHPLQAVQALRPLRLPPASPWRG